MNMTDGGLAICLSPSNPWPDGGKWWSRPNDVSLILSGFIQQLMRGRYRQAKRVHIVLDHLNRHFAKGFVDVLGEKRAAKLLSRIQFHYTPAHASWLNMAEIEIGILDQQCLNRRIPTEAELVREVRAWTAKRNRQRKTIHWSFTKEQADKKLGKHYVDVA
jgi:hypothetical protein